MFARRILAIAALGCALLFAMGVAVAQDPPVFVFVFPGGVRTPEIATETIPANREIVVATQALLRISPKNLTLAAEDDYFLRVVLDGALWRTDSNGMLPSLHGQSPSWTTSPVEGGAGKNRLVYKLGGNVSLGTRLSLSIQSHLKVLNADPGDVSATLTLHTEQFDAIEGRNAVNTSHFGGTLVIVRKVEGLDLQVSKGEAAVADVATAPAGFLWFLNKAGNRFTGGNSGTDTSGPNVSNVKLGFAQAALRTGVVYNASGGVRLAIADVMPPSGFSVTVEGDLSVGALDLVRQTSMGTAPNITYQVSCPQRRGSTSSPAAGNIGPPSSSDTSPRSQTASVMPAPTPTPGVNDLAGIATRHHLCLEVDNAGAGTNRRPIQAQEFKGTVSVTPLTPGQPVKKVEGVIGKIVRNGAAVNLPYLTVAENYNQRLIIVNRGPTPATWELGNFTAEAGLTVGLSDAAQATQDNGRNRVPAGGQVTLPVASLLKFTGGNGAAHASAALSLNANKTNIQVATTQVNLEDGSTDTVVYPAIDSAAN